MARQRFIHPSIWNSDQFCSLSPNARLLFIGVFSTADDEGRRKASAASLKGEIFPQDSSSLPEVLLWRHELERANLIRVYSADGIELLDLPTWNRYQKPKYPTPSKLPEFRKDSPSLPPALEEDSPTGRDGLGRVGMGRDGSGEPKEQALVGTNRRPDISEDEPEQQKPSRKPLSQQEGALGECAKTWRKHFGSEMTASKEDIINFHRKRRNNAHLKDHVFGFAFGLMLGDEFWRTNGASFSAFVRNFDKYLSRTELEKGDYADASGS